MAHILQLPAQIAELIAAGEVVERPASVVKELAENAIDAGATAITVEIQNGGMSCVRVSDNGCGIAPDEVETAFLRHATSKIKVRQDLESIATLGFRGEALAAIAAVSRIDILTRRPEDAFGVSLSLEGGSVLHKEEAGCPAGTTILVHNLFYNTPARLKFMKKDAAESAACLSAVYRLALSHPEVAFKCIRDGKQDLLTPGDAQLRSALYAVLGRDFALGFVPVQGGSLDLAISGFVSLPSCCRGNRGYQFFFVNGRCVKNKILSSALEQAYDNRKMVGKFPGCVLHISVNPRTIDVNVHPSKEEIKFSSDRPVLEAVYQTVFDALERDSSLPTAMLSSSVKPERQEHQQDKLFLASSAAQKASGSNSVLRSPPVARMAEQVEQMGKTEREKITEIVERAQRAQVSSTVGERTGRTGTGKSFPPSVEKSSGKPLENPPKQLQIPEQAAESEKVFHMESPNGAKKSPPVSERSDEPPEDQLSSWRVVGELFRTYIVVEQGSRVLLIDKHAAHERMNFNRMRAETYVPLSQSLLTPVIFVPLPEESQILLDNQNELETLGFEVEDFGGGSLAVRRIPDYLETGEVEATLTELAGSLLTNGKLDPDQRRDALLRTMACKAATKSGWKNAPAELEEIVKAVLAKRIQYCPHGRPVAIEMTRAQLDTQFHRRR